ncbi:MAG: helix-turn-helix transcriptional regulator [Planctomycetota bacterium]|nr:helix-turn-helix transcriptional regulator [Planctomycetota bacterium]
MHKSQVRPPLLVPLPEGRPVYAGRLGRYVAAPGRLPVTVLHNDWDIFWVRRGQGVWELLNGERLTAGPDEFAILPPFTTAVTHEGRAPLDFWHCHFDFQPVQGRMIEPHRADSLGPGRRATVPLVFTRREAPGVWRAYRALSLVDVEKPGEPWRLERAVLDLIAALAAFGEARARRRLPGRPFEPSEARDDRVRLIQRRIEAEPARRWRVAELADLVDLSPGHLHERCRAVLGRSLKRFIVETRLRRALTLLRERPGDRRPSVKEVSAACGFATQHFFSRQFKSYFGVGPLEYRDGATLA